MILNIGKYYLYRHIRSDKNEVFYIGVGTKTDQDILYNTYTRAISKRGRNYIWRGIVSRNPNYEVEILIESDEYDFILQKEIEFVALYGRIIKETGTLANLTDGGEGTVGWRHSEESKRKMSLNLKGRVVSKESIEKTKRTKIERGFKPSVETGRKISKAALVRWKNNPPKFEKNKIFQYDSEGNFIKHWENGILLEKELKLKRVTINKYCRGFNNSFYKNNFWFYTYKGNKLDSSLIIINLKNTIRKVAKIEINTSRIIEVFNSAKEAGRSINKGITTSATGCIRECCIEGGRQNIAYGFKWQYI